MREREIKLVAEDPDFRLAALHGDDEFDVGTATTTELDATYFDTADLRLTRAGASLRFRAPEGWTVKLPGRTAGAMLTRAERSFGGGPGCPPVAALDAVRALTRGSRVDVVARLHTRRTRVDVCDETGRTIAEIVDDAVSVRDAPAPAASFRELEVELAPDASTQVAKQLVRRLRTAGAGRPEPVPKIVRALGAPARRPSDIAVPRAPGKRAMADEVILAAVAGSVAGLVAHDAAIRKGDHPEDVHQARVAVRRLRSDLRTFAPLMERAWAEPVGGELAWLSGVLGGVRDVDVLSELLKAQIRSLPEDHRPVAKRLLERLGRLRACARSDLMAAMRSVRYDALLDGLVAGTSVASIAPGTPSVRGADALPPLVKRPWKNLRSAVRDAGRSPTDHALHEIRIAAKRARYATEAVAPVVGRRATKLARRLGSLQDVLGTHHDAIVAQHWLHEAARVLRGDEAFVAGELATLLHCREQTAGVEWVSAWRSASDRELRGWF
jgi:CHAD domain-containing protein